MKNLFVSHAGDSLITVVQNHNRYKLLADFDQTNVILHEIKAGSSVWLTPDPKFPRYMEYYTLLEGELILHCGEEGDTHLSAGDSFYTTGLECDVSIFPQTDLKLLCFSSKPLFSDFMAFVNDLNDLNGQITIPSTTAAASRALRWSSPIGCTFRLTPSTICCSPRCITTSENAICPRSFSISPAS